MKNFLTTVQAFLFCFVLALTICVIGNGCARPSAQRAAFGATTAVVTSVDALMGGWGQYVLGERLRIRGLTDPVDRQKQAHALVVKEVKVAQAYADYLVNANTVVSAFGDTNNVPAFEGPALAALTAVIAQSKL